MTLLHLAICWQLTLDLDASAYRRCVAVAPAAVSAATAHGVDPAVLLAQGWVETGWTTPRRRSVCGMWQVASSAVDCGKAERSPAVAAEAGARMLAAWTRAARRRGLPDAKGLSGYACGWSGLRDGCGWYARKVLARARVAQ